MNDFLLPVEERKRRELLSFARMVVIAFSLGLAVAFVIAVTGWGF
jgi:hypothetical protein